MSTRRKQARHVKRIKMGETKRAASKAATMIQRIIKGSVQRGN